MQSNEAWVRILHELSDTAPATLERLANHHQVRYEPLTWSAGKGGVRTGRDAAGVPVEVYVGVKLELSRAEREVTLIHELFHLVVANAHPAGGYMMHLQDEAGVRYIEAKIDKAAYAFRARWPAFTARLYHRCFGRFEAKAARS